MEKPLEGITVVVTRPVHQAHSLCQLIESCGGTALRFPVLEIGEPQDPHGLSDLIKRLGQFDIAIFVSPNAAQWGMKSIQAFGGFPAHVKVAAVGQGTAKKLTELGVSVDIFPTEQFNSEALLAMDEFIKVAGKHIVIFRGEGGRELLADTLGARGADVEYAECYRRLRPATNTAKLHEQLTSGAVDIITVTSNESLQNLYDMVGETDRQYLLNVPLIVVSDRGQQLALELGFNNPAIIAEKASDQALLEAVIHWTLKQSNL